MTPTGLQALKLLKSRDEFRRLVAGGKISGAPAVYLDDAPPEDEAGA